MATSPQPRPFTHAPTPGRPRRNWWRPAGWALAAGLLLLPLVAMQFTPEVNWTASDFAVAALLLGGTGLAFEATVRLTRNTAYRTAVGLALAGAFLLIWVNGAVGIIGSERNPANLLYAGVLAVGIGGAVVARLQPQGMARALAVTAGAQTLVALLALVEQLERASVLIVVNGFFVALFVGAALLFQRAAAPPREPIA